MQEITSSNNPRFRDAVRLHSSRGRKQQRRIIIFGLRETARAIDAGIRIKELFVGSDFATDETFPFLESHIAATDTIQFDLEKGLFQKLMFGSRSDGIIAVADRPSTELARFPVDVRGILLIVQSPENPGNLGAIARCADGAGAGGIIIADSITDVYHPNSIRASIGTVFSIPIATANTEELQAWLVAHRFKSFVARPDADADVFEVDLTGRCAVVLGNEATGVSEQWKSRDLSQVKLPMLGLADSLNVSTSASIFCYEALRQRRNPE